jgi:hypothetical protein
VVLFVQALRQIPEEQVGPRAFGAPWHDHLNMRDERVEIFSQRMFGGTYEFSYFARATSLGSFSAPPAYAEVRQVIQELCFAISFIFYSSSSQRTGDVQS